MSRIALLLASLCLSGAVAAQDYPAKPLRILVGFPPGSSTDVITRIVAQKVAEQWGQPVIVENRGGAGGNVAAQVISKATPDGYLVLATSNAVAINLTLYRAPGFAVTDLAPIVKLGETSSTISLHPSVPANTLKELVELARKTPLSYASAGTGTGGHILMEWLKKGQGIDITHVPFAPATAANAVVGNQATMGLVSLPPILPHLKAGRVKVIVVTSERRAAALPDVPTVAEAGYPGFFDALWLALFAPAGTPPAIVERINAEVNRAIESPDVRERFAGLGIETQRNSVAEWNADFRREYEKFRKVIPEIGVRAD